MYYPDHIVEEVRSRNNIVDVIGGTIALKKKGANYFGLCPFHGEKTASFSVSEGKQMFYCFGCHKGGDVVKYLMEYENISFQDALQELAARVGYQLPEEGELSAEEKKVKSEKDTLREINKQAAYFFYASLKGRGGEPGHRYLLDRRLTELTIRGFGLGYADQGRDSLYRYLRGKGFQDDILRESGLFSFTERGVYDKFFNRVIYPIMDQNGHVIGFGGRVMGKGEPKYLNSPETRLFDKSRNLFALNFAKRSRKDAMILCEGYMDVITLHQSGFTNAVASLGTALTEPQARLLKRYVSDILLTYDSDRAGVNAAKRAIPILEGAGLVPKIMDLRPYKDPDEFLQAESPEAFQERIERARNAFLWLVDVLKQDYDLQDPAGQTEYMREVARRIANKFREPLERENYIRAVAREQLMEKEGLQSLVEHSGETREMPRKLYLHSREKLSGEVRETPMAKTEKQILSILAEHRELAVKLKERLSPEELSDPVGQEILRAFYEGRNAHQILDQYRDREREYEKVVGLFQGAEIPPEERDSIRQMLEDLVKNIRIQKIKEEIENTVDAGRLSELFLQEEKLKTDKIF